MRILIAEDERKLATLLKRGFEREGMAVDVVNEGPDALARGRATEYDAIILDVMLPGLDGFRVCRALREAGVWSPVLMLTARDAVRDRVAGLDAGADDYLTKPFAPKELSARIRALLRRARTPEHVPSGQALRFGDLEVVPDQGVVRLADKEVHLTKTEFRLLCELASSPGRVFSREVLLERVWGYGYFGDGRLVDVHVRRLRTKVENDPANPRHVVTVRGLGYKLQT